MITKELMMNNEMTQVGRAADWYVSGQLESDKKLIGFRYRTWKPRLQGSRCLELGPADGVMTQYLIQHFEQLTIVDAADNLLKLIPDHENLVKVHSLFEDYEPENTFDSIMLEHILEHVEDPIALMSRVKEWLAPGGKLFLGVPNGGSIHRLAAVKMGLLKHECELNDRDLSVGHRRVYKPETFRKDIEASGLRVVEMGGVFLKPVSNGQIDDTWNDAMLEGFYQLGKDFPDIAADIFCVCEKACE